MPMVFQVKYKTLPASNLQPDNQKTSDITRFETLILYNQLSKNFQKMDQQLNFDGQSMFTVNNYDQEGFGQSLKESNLGVTAAQEDHTMQEERFFQKEDINSEDELSISFERSLLSQHSSVLTWELKIYLESVQNFLKETNKQILKMFPEGLYKVNKDITCQELISAQEGQLTVQFKNKLLSDLKTYDKLQQFLDIVVKTCPAEIAIELVKISQQIQEEYARHLNDCVGLLDLYVLMNLAFQKSKKLENIHKLNLDFMASSTHQYRKLMLKYQKFAEVYCVTVILVLALYFENPYFEETMIQQPKRLLRQFQMDDNAQMEEEVDLKAQKKRKSSK